jgi:hypothetical protein
MVMTLRRTALVASALALALCSTLVQAQNIVWVRGTITGYDGHALSMQSREGREVKISLAPDASVSYPKALKLSDVKPGTALGTSAVRRPDGKLVALELHVFPPERGLPGEGHRPWDLEPNATMTNARVTSTVKANDGQELTLIYQGGTQQVVVPPGTPIVMAVDGDRSMLKPGEYAFVAATVDKDGRLRANRVQVSRDGVKPPM